MGEIHVVTDTITVSFIFAGENALKTVGELVTEAGRLAQQNKVTLVGGTTTIKVSDFPVTDAR